MLSSNYGRKDPLKFYKVLRNIVGFLLRSRVRFEGTDLIPENGAVVLIANHQNALDPVAVGLALKRPVHFLAKKELFENKFLNWFLTHLLCIPIDRDGMDRAALKKAIRVLDDEGVLGIFPDGTREKADGAAFGAVDVTFPLAGSERERRGDGHKDGFENLFHGR